MAFLKKVDVIAGEGPHSFYLAAGLLEQLPALVEYLSLEKWPDETPRERSSLLVIVESGTLKLCLSDRANNRTLWRSGASLEDALLAMETALQSDQADWRRSTPKAAYGGKPNRKN